MRHHLYDEHVLAWIMQLSWSDKFLGIVARHNKYHREMQS